MNAAGYITMALGALMVGFLALVAFAAIGWFIVPLVGAVVYFGRRAA